MFFHSSKDEINVFFFYQLSISLAYISPLNRDFAVKKKHLIWKILDWDWVNMWSEIGACPKIWQMRSGNGWWLKWAQITYTHPWHLCFILLQKEKKKKCFLPFFSLYVFFYDSSLKNAEYWFHGLHVCHTLAMSASIRWKERGTRLPLFKRRTHPTPFSGPAID